MKIYWVCLHNTYIKRKATFALETEFEVELVEDIVSNGGSIVPTIIEARELSDEAISMALSSEAAIFIENHVIEPYSLQIIRSLALSGIPFFWDINDVMYYLKTVVKVSSKTGSYSETLKELIKLEGSFHSVNVSELSMQLAERLHCPTDVAYMIRSAALLHDIGKLLMPKSFVNAPRWYTNIEKEYIKLHSFYGKALLRKISGHNVIFDQIASDVILYHHERINGRGYPIGKRGEEIPLSARIVAVADVYDALRSNRPYRSACDHDLAITYLKGKEGMFDEKVIKALEDILDENSNIRSENQGRSYGYCLRRG